MKIKLENLTQVSGKYLFDVPMAPLTWFKVGGNADVLFKPQDVHDLSLFLKNLDKKIPYTVVGCASNLIIRDKGFRGVIIKLGRGFNELRVEGTKIIAGGAVLDKNIALTAAANSISGLEFLVGIPGSIGAGVKINAGAYGGEVKDVFVRAEAVDNQGNILTLEKGDIKFFYRDSTLAEGFIVTKVELEGFRASKEEIISKTNKMLQEKKSTQPMTGRTGGSTFKNPEGKRAWELIDKAGCRGKIIGDAIMSPQHCNFMINQGSASAEDLETLGEEVRKKVKENSGIDLEWEIEIIGDK